MAEPPSAKRDEYCCVPLCNGNDRVHSELSFHHFPCIKKNDLKKKWIIAIRRDEGPHFKVGGNTVVCAKHFKAADFRWTSVRKCLKTNAVPSIFAWTTDTPQRRPPTQRTSPLHKKVLAEIPQDNSNVETALISENQVPQNQNLQLTIATAKTSDLDFTNNRILELEKKLEEKEKEIEAKDQEINGLTLKLKMERFGVTRFSFDNDMIEFYTGFPSYALFLAFFALLKPSALHMKSVYYNPKEELSIKGRPKSMEPIDELFMFLCRLRCGLLSEDLSVRFNIHKSSVSRKIISWANYLYFLLGSLNIWASRDKIEMHKPQDFRIMYPNTRIIIDCTEIFCERPSSLALGSKTYSSYKSHNTWKGLVGIAPHGAVTFISSLYSGCISDIEIMKHSGLLQLLEPGDQIMADKGFILNKLLENTGVSIATPHFLCADGQFAQSQIEENQNISSLRIHVERHIKRVKEYRLFSSVVPLSLAGSVNQLWTVANLLTLFKRPLIKKKN